MNRNIPTPSQLAAVKPLLRDYRAAWVASIDFHGNQCRSLINVNSLTGRLDFAPTDAPIHQVCEIRDRNGNRLL
jgi:hypothetical protein